MGLFKKELCVLCDRKTGLLDKKCIDGKVCKECRDKLSVWFDDYKNSTKEQMLSQLEQKAADEEKAPLLEFNKIYGEAGVILIDEKARVFTAFPDTSSSFFGNNKKVSSIQDVMEFHPDLISFDSVEDLEIDIRQMTHEEKKTENGEQVSYDPPHYVYMYTFTLRFKINHPYIKSVYVTLNSDSVKIKNIGPRAWTDPGRKLAAHLLNLPGLIVEDQEEYYDNDSLLKAFLRSKYEMPDMSYGFKCTRENWEQILMYQYYLAMAREIKETIIGKEE